MDASCQSQLIESSNESVLVIVSSICKIPRKSIVINYYVGLWFRHHINWGEEFGFDF